MPLEEDAITHPKYNSPPPKEHHEQNPHPQDAITAFMGAVTFGQSVTIDPDGHAHYRDEKSQIQALDRTRPDQPLEKGRPAARKHDYKRNGTTTLFAALDLATGKLSADKCYPKHTIAEFVDFLGLVAAAHPDVELHVVCDNYATHKHPNVKAWLAENPRVTMHFTPTSCSWLNMVTIFFGIITKQAIRRGSFQSVDDLEATIRAYIDSYNTRATPFIWTKALSERWRNQNGASSVLPSSLPILLGAQWL